MKFLHTSDIHLGAKFTMLGEKASLQRKRVEETFGAILELAKKERVDVFLVAGDLFDSNHIPPAVAEFTKTKLEELGKAGIRVCLLPGNHDLLRQDSIYTRERLNELENVFVFQNPEGEIFEFPEFGTAIAGKPVTAKKSTKSPLLIKFETQMENRIIVAHGAVQISGKSAADANPITLEEIANSGAHYIALGDWHSLQEYSAGGVTAWYCGAPELLAMDQRGAGYVILGKIENGKVEVLPKRVGKREADAVAVDIAEVQTAQELRERILTGAHDDLVREVRIRGLNTNRVFFEADEIEEELGEKFFRLRAVDETRVPLEEFSEKDYPEAFIIGQFVKLMREKIKNAKTQEGQKVYEDALQLGIAELNGQRVID